MGIQQTQQAVAEFVDTRIMTALDKSSPVRWMIGGASTLAISRLDNILKTYAPILKSLGVLDETGNLILTVVERFVSSAFEKQSSVTMPILGIPFTFNADDGRALIDCLKRYGG